MSATASIQSTAFSGLATEIGGAVAKGAAAYQKSDATRTSAEIQASAARTNAIIAENQARDAKSRGVEEATRRRLATSQLRGKQRAQLAANGVVLNEGSAASILNDTDLLGAFDENTIIANAEREAMGYRTQAANYLDSASLLKSRAEAESPFMSASSALLTSGMQVADNWYKYKQSTGGPVKKTR